MTSKRIKILFIGFNVNHTGFTRVMHSIIAHLDDEFDIHFAALGLEKGDAIYDFNKNVTMHYYDKNGKFDPLRNSMATDFLKNEKPDLVFMLNDLWFLKHYYKSFKEALGNAKLIYYAPVDGEIKDYQCLEHFDIVDEIVAYTNFGKMEIQKGLNTVFPKGKSTKAPKTTIVLHGVDTQRFRPLGDISTPSFLQKNKLEAKRKLWGEELANEDSFIVLNANRFQERKCIDITMEGFANFAKGKPSNVKLCLHHAVLPFGEEELIKNWIQKYGLEERVIFSSVKNKEEYIDDERLNLIYNACDVGINTSYGEGWGLISFEHAATGAAQIVPMHSACHELWKDSALLLTPVEQVRPVNHPMEFAKVSAIDVTRHLQLLYEDHNARFEWTQRAYSNVQKSAYNWKSIGQNWSKLFKKHIYEKVEI